ncbi:MAG TPA: hypothetical protein PLL10_04025, partial [Elusimicrobiales bacterium]|nr:hypothetical protein [Elusimicrobiales bacterium]
MGLLIKRSLLALTLSACAPLILPAYTYAQSAQTRSVSPETREVPVTTPQLLEEIKDGQYRGTTPLMFRWNLLSMNKILLSDWAKVRRYVFRHPEFFWSPNNKSGILTPDKGVTLSTEERDALVQMESACESQLARQDIYMGDMSFRSPIKTAGLNEPLANLKNTQSSRLFSPQTTNITREQSQQTKENPTVQEPALSQSLEDPKSGNSELEWARAQMEAKDYKGAAESATKALQ